MVFQFFSALLLVVSTLFNAIPLDPVSRVKSAVCGSGYAVLSPNLELFCGTLDVLSLPPAPAVITIDAPPFRLDFRPFQINASHNPTATLSSLDGQILGYARRTSTISPLSSSDPTSMDDDWSLYLMLLMNVLVLAILVVVNVYLVRYHFDSIIRGLTWFFCGPPTSEPIPCTSTPSTQRQLATPALQPASISKPFVESVMRGLTWFFCGPPSSVPIPYKGTPPIQRQQATPIVQPARISKPLVDSVVRGLTWFFCGPPAAELTTRTYTFSQGTQATSTVQSIPLSEALVNSVIRGLTWFFCGPLTPEPADNPLDQELPATPVLEPTPVLERFMQSVVRGLTWFFCGPRPLERMGSNDGSVSSELAEMAGNPQPEGAEQANRSHCGGRKAGKRKRARERRLAAQLAAEAEVRSMDERSRIHPDIVELPESGNEREPTELEDIGRDSPLRRGTRRWEENG